MQTKVMTNNKNSGSLRVTLPQAVGEILNLKKGDYVEWTPEVENGEIVVKLSKVDMKKWNIPQHKIKKME